MAETASDFLIKRIIEWASGAFMESLAVNAYSCPPFAKLRLTHSSSQTDSVAASKSDK
jgi:hypothetical protein